MVILWVVSKIRDFCQGIADKLSRFIDKQLKRRFEGK